MPSAGRGGGPGGQPQAGCGALGAGRAGLRLWSPGTGAGSRRAGVGRERQICWRRRERCCLAKYFSKLIKGTEMSSGPLKTLLRFNTKTTHLTWKVNDRSAARVSKWAPGTGWFHGFLLHLPPSPRPPLSPFPSPWPDPVLKSCLHRTVYLSGEEEERETISGDGSGERRKRGKSWFPRIFQVRKARSCGHLPACEMGGQVHWDAVPGNSASLPSWLRLNFSKEK